MRVRALHSCSFGTLRACIPTHWSAARTVLQWIVTVLPMSAAWPPAGRESTGIHTLCRVAFHAVLHLAYGPPARLLFGLP